MEPQSIAVHFNEGEVHTLVVRKQNDTLCAQSDPAFATFAILLG